MEQDRNRFISLRVKMSIGIVLICGLIGATAIFSVNKLASDIVDKEYSDKTEQISEAVTTTLDLDDVVELTDTVMNVYYSLDSIVPSEEWGSDEWNAYMANYEGITDLPVFVRLRDHMRVYQEIFGVDCIYITVPKHEVCNSIYIVDSADEEDACPPGVVDAYEDGIWPDETDKIAHATFTNTVYGWLVTGGYPIMVDGEPAAYLFVDISMNDVKAKERVYVVSITLIIIALTLLLLIVALWYMNRNVIRPVAKLSDTARNYCSENNDVVHHNFEKLSFKTHDEISLLLSSMKQMEADMNANINTLVDTKVALKETEEKANTMQALAVRDALTGIRNKTAYDYEVKKLEEDLADGFNEFGLAMVDLNFLKKTNDTYGHEKGNISIRRLCMLVCEIFEHSPVFRVGGDEFVVVLKNRDFRNIDNLIEDFNNRITAYQEDNTLQPWEQISAAIGFAKFEKGEDKNVEDVFKRADKAMYARKEAMKAARKD